MRTYYPLPAKIGTLETMARDTVGDDRSPNLFFVTDRGRVTLVSRSFPAAYGEWRRLADRRGLDGNRLECALEDRQTGVVASVSPVDDSPGARLVVDDCGENWHNRTRKPSGV